MSIRTYYQPSILVIRLPPEFKAVFQSSFGLTIALIAREIGQTN